jgi:hypothetical protein
VLNPLAVGVFLGGQLLDRVVPRPKLRYGRTNRALSPLSTRRFEEVSRDELRQRFEESPVVGGVPLLGV